MDAYEQPYDGRDSYTVTLFGTDWELPLVEIEDGTYIASDAGLVLGTTAFVEAAASELAARLEAAQLAYLVTPEAKALPLTQALARRLDIGYAVVRKSVKDYMRDPRTMTAESITTAGEQQLVLDGPAAAELCESPVAVVDDAVSTGGTMRALDALLADVGAEVVTRAAVFEEGQEHPDIHTLASLPLFVDRQ
jgi:adenine phosphoribosyltransferase